MGRWSRNSTVALAALALGACVSLRPFAEVRREVPAGDYVRVDGRLVHARARGSGPPLVLLHGFGASSWSWSKVEPDLGSRFRTVAIDLYGFGWTERVEDPEAYTLEGQSRLVLGVLDALGIERAILGGHSYGGAISLYLAERHPERVAALLLVDNAMPEYAAKRRSRFLPRALAALAVRTTKLSVRNVRRGLEEAYFDDAEVDEALVAAYREPLRVEGAARAFWALTKPRPEPPYPLDLATIEAPTLVVWGEEDALIDVDAAEERTRALPAGRFVRLPRCGHNPMEECPEAFFAAAQPFLEGLSP
jgi:pimeloyl-ACP methyl ester carboxylesterase